MNDRNLAPLDHEQLMYDIIAHIYDAASDSHAWTTVLKEITQLTGSISAVLLYQDHEVEHASTFASYGVDTTWLTLYNEKYGAVDPTFDVIASVPTGELTTTNRIDHADKIYKSQTYHEFYKPQGMFHLAGTWLIRNEHRSALLGFQRKESANEYETEVLSRVRQLVPHFQKALHIYRTHTEAIVKNNALSSGIDTMQMGIIFFDHQGQVSYRNKSAKNILKCHPAISMHNNIVYASTKECNKRLREAIANASISNINGKFTEPVAIGLKHCDKLSPLPVLITPIHQSNFSPLVSKRGIAAVMTLTDPDQMAMTSPELLRTVYDLTKSESEVAVGLANAMSAKEISAVKGVQLTTIRTQIQSIFAKMGVKTQAQLMKILLYSPLAKTK